MEYNFTEIEKKWQKFWSDNKTFKTDINPSKPKFYVLDMFPYPSGAGLHVGHPLGYIASDNRGFETIEANFKNGFPNSSLNHDCWKPHLKTNAKIHQICTSHLLRELEYLNELYEYDWPENFKKLLLDAIDLKRIMTRDDYYPDNKNVQQIILRFNKLLEQNQWNKEHKKIISFHARMVRLKDYVFPFLFFPEIPPDNNASERAIRNVKVKQKISGQFKTILAA